MDIFQFWNVYRTVCKKDFVFLARVRVSSQYFPVLDCISYSCARKRSWLSLWFSSGYFQFWNVYRTVRKKDFVFLARVRVSSQYFPVLDCISYSCARKRSWLSLWLGLAVDIFQFWNVYRTVRKKDFVFLARVRVSSQYFPVLDCISYSCARKRSWLSLWLGLAWIFYSFGMYIVQYARRTSCFSLGLGLAVSIFQFWNVYYSPQEEFVEGRIFYRIVVFAAQERTSWLSLGLGLAVSIFQFWIVYHTVAQERDRGSRCG